MGAKIFCIVYPVIILEYKPPEKDFHHEEHEEKEETLHLLHGNK